MDQDQSSVWNFTFWTLQNGKKRMYLCVCVCQKQDKKSYSINLPLLRQRCPHCSSLNTFQLQTEQFVVRQRLFLEPRLWRSVRTVVPCPTGGGRCTAPTPSLSESFTKSSTIVINLHSFDFQNLISTLISVPLLQEFVFFFRGHSPQFENPRCILFCCFLYFGPC